MHTCMARALLHLCLATWLCRVCVSYNEERQSAPAKGCPWLSRELEALPEEQRGALHGVPFGVKDNIDVSGFPTTAACKDFLYHPSVSATVVEPLLAAGALLDQADSSS